MFNDRFIDRLMERDFGRSNENDNNIFHFLPSLALIYNYLLKPPI